MSTVASLQIRFGADIAEAQKAFRTLRGSLIPFERAMEAVGKKLTTHVTAPMTILGGVALKTSIDFESAFAGVRKTVDATEAQFAALEAGIRQMATEIPASADEIARVAEVAGQLGIPVDDILAFTRVMVDLGESTDLASDAAATLLARFANVTGIGTDNFDRLGSVIVALGNKFEASESEIAALAQRLAASGRVAGLSAGEIMAFSAALTAVGVTAEVGGTAFSKLFAQVHASVATGNKDLATFARVSGMTAEQFADAFRTDPAGAIASFVEGLGQIQESGGNTHAVLQALGISEERMTRALLSAALGGDKLREALLLQNAAWTGNRALMEEALKRYGTTASLLQILRNRLAEVARTFGDVLKPALRVLIDLTTPFIQAIQFMADQFKALPQPIQVVIGLFLGFVAALGPLLVVAAQVASVLNVLALSMLAWSAWTKLLAAFPALGMVVQGVMQLIGGVLRRMALAFVLVTAKAALLVAGFLALKELIVRAKADFGILTDAVSKAFGTIRSAGKPAMEELKGSLQTVLEAMKRLWEQHSAFLLSRVRTAVEGVFTRIGIALNGLAQVIALVLDIMQKDWGQAWDRMKFMAGTSATIILGMFAKILGGIQSFVTHLPGVGTAMAAGMDPAIAGLRGLSANIETAISDLVPEADQAGVDMSALLDKIFGKPEKEPWTPDPTVNEKLEKFLAERRRILQEELRGDLMDPGRLGALPESEIAPGAALDFLRVGDVSMQVGGETVSGQIRTFGAAVHAEMARVRERIHAQREGWAREFELFSQLGDILRNGLNASIEAFAEGMGELVAGTTTWSNVGEKLLGVVAGVMQALGSALIAFGTAGVAFNAAGGFFSFLANPFAAIAAGAILLAGGAIIKGILSRGQKKGGAGGGWGRQSTGGLNVNPNTASTAGGGDFGGDGSDRLISLELASTVQPSGAMLYSVQQGNRRLARRGQPMV